MNKRQKVDALREAKTITTEVFAVGSGEWSLEVSSERGFLFELVGSTESNDGPATDLWGELDELHALAKIEKISLSDILSEKEIEAFYLRDRPANESLEIHKEGVIDYVNKVEAEGLCVVDDNEIPYNLGSKTMSGVLLEMESSIWGFSQYNAEREVLKLKEDFALEIQQNLPAELWKFLSKFHDKREVSYYSDFIVICNGRGKSYRFEG